MNREKEVLEKDLLRKTIAKRLRELRESRSMTQEQVSFKIDVSATTVSRYEDKEKDSVPDVLSLYRYCKSFNVSADYLLGLSELRNPVEEYVKDGKDILKKAKKLKYLMEGLENELDDLEMLKEEE